MSTSKPTDMHEIVAESNWDGLLERLETNPEEASIGIGTSYLLEDDMLGANNMTPLHLLCTRPHLPPTVLEAYLKAAPNSIRIVTDSGFSPLHFACYCRQIRAIILLLVTADPELLTFQENLQHWNPFHLCIKYGSRKDVMKTLLDCGKPNIVAKALASEDRQGKTPIALACEHQKINLPDFILLRNACLNMELKRPLLQELSLGFHSILNDSLRTKLTPKVSVVKCPPSRYCNPKKQISIEGTVWSLSLGKSYAIWDCMHKLLFLLGVTDKRQLVTFPLLHEIIRQDMDCTTLFFDAILLLNPYYVCQVDPNGDLPIHVAARHANKTNECNRRLQILIRDYPRSAALANREGKLPLEMLSDTNVKVVRMLVNACPLALSRLRLHDSLLTSCKCSLPTQPPSLSY
jgi:ankyrin repeat protein